MGNARVKPLRLAEKLLAIRTKIDATQQELAERLSIGKVTIRRSDISRFELGLREPPLVVILRYARLAKITVEMLIDDDLNV